MTEACPFCLLFSFESPVLSKKGRFQSRTSRVKRVDLCEQARLDQFQAQAYVQRECIGTSGCRPAHCSTDTG